MDRRLAAACDLLVLPRLMRIGLCNARSLMLVLSLIVSACTGALRWEPDTYTVRAGDTLYAIAWRFGVDHRDLAHWNGLGDGGLIYPGQELTLSRPAGLDASAARENQKTPRTGPSSRDVPRTAKTQPSPRWLWPVDGDVVARFGDDTSIGNGIDISGKLESPVLAAAAGRIVYSGSGLIGYGKLIIVKHNDTYLSAYGHNNALLVEQGDVIVAGQQIARMGEGPGNRPLLHFEIRVNGKAVDPIDYLPSR